MAAYVGNIDFVAVDELLMFLQIVQLLEIDATLDARPPVGLDPLSILLDVVDEGFDGKRKNDRILIEETAHRSGRRRKSDRILEVHGLNIDNGIVAAAAAAAAAGDGGGGRHRSRHLRQKLVVGKQIFQFFVLDRDESDARSFQRGFSFGRSQHLHHFVDLVI